MWMMEKKGHRWSWWVGVRDFLLGSQRDWKENRLNISALSPRYVAPLFVRDYKILGKIEEATVNIK